MKKIHINLIGYGNVGAGVVKYLLKERHSLKTRLEIDFVIKTICDRSVRKKLPEGLGKIHLTTDISATLKDPEADVIIELIGGQHPAKEIALEALQNGKHVITANKDLIANYGKQLFQEAHKRNRNIFFESSVMAGVPVIKTITEGVVGNYFRGLYGIINGTCNYILTEMERSNLTFADALKEAQDKGFAESDPTLDINGMDSAHKICILVGLAFRKHIKLKDVHIEGITHISHDDIQFAQNLGLTIKLLAIAKKLDNEIEVRVHPTLLPQDHPLAAIQGIYNAIYMQTDPLQDLLLSGEGAGQMTAALGVISDLINLASRENTPAARLLGNIYQEDEEARMKKFDDVLTKFYIRFMATDKPGILSKITGVLGKHGISINSVTQKAHNRMATVPVVILTEAAPEKKMRTALHQIYQRGIVKIKPVAIRMEN